MSDRYRPSYVGLALAALGAVLIFVLPNALTMLVCFVAAMSGLGGLLKTPNLATVVLFGLCSAPFVALIIVITSID